MGNAANEGILQFSEDFQQVLPEGKGWELTTDGFMQFICSLYKVISSPWALLECL